MSYHTDAQKFIKGSKAQGRTVTREGSELIASKPATTPSKEVNKQVGNKNHVMDALHSLVDHLGGTSRVDAAENPASANSMMTRKINNTKPQPPVKSKPFESSLPKNQKTFGVPGAK